MIKSFDVAADDVVPEWVMPYVATYATFYVETVIGWIAITAPEFRNGLTYGVEVEDE